MSVGGAEKNWWERPNVVVTVLTIVAVSGLVSVFVPLVLGWKGELSSERVQFYVTQVGVPLLTFAGFLAVYLGFLSQREQNELQERQIETQRRQIEAQQENFQKDRFESTFFQLLRTHNQIVEDIRIEQMRKTTDHSGPFETARKVIQEKDSPFLNTDVIPIEIRGRSCFEQFYSELKELFEDKADEDITSVYKEWYKDRKSHLNHYFNNLSRIISFVDNREFLGEWGENKKHFYISLLISQMSIPELVLFFYHSFSLREDKGYMEEVYLTLEKYTFFEQIRPESSLIHESHEDLHPEALSVQR